MRINKDTPTVLVPIEIVTRELPAKLALASALAAEGFRSVVGHKEAVAGIARESKSVIWHGKSLFDPWGSEPFVVDSLIENASAVMAHDEEGGIYPQDEWEDSVLQNHMAEALRDRKIARICLWGEKQKETLARLAPELRNTLTVTGSPRFDLCLPGYGWIDDIGNSEDRTRCVPYILVNTRFSSVVHTLGPEDWFRRNLANGLSPSIREKAQDRAFTTWHRDANDFAEMMQLIKALAFGHPNHTLVLRPHPSESLTFYREAFSSFGNVHVTRDHSVLYWIRYADLVVHCKCTTGVEAALSGRPVLHFWPRREQEFELAEEVAREAGVTVSTRIQALDVARDLLAKVVPPQSWSPRAMAILNNLKAPAVPLLVREILGVARERGINSSVLKFPQWLKEFLPRKSETAEARYVASKRRSMVPDGEHIQAVVDGCRNRGFGAGNVSHVAHTYVVIEPA